MKPTTVAWWLFATGACAACVYVPMGDLPSVDSLSVSQLAGGNAQVRVKPQFAEGGLRTQSVVSAYGRADVAHLVLQLSVLNGASESVVLDSAGVPVQKDIDSTNLDQPVVFNKLAYLTTYRIRALAFKAPGTASVDLISTRDASSSVDLTVAKDDRPILGNLPVQLIDRIFNGQATSSAIDFSPGQVITDGIPAID